MRKKAQRFYQSPLLYKGSWLAEVAPTWEVKSSNGKDFYVVAAEKHGFTCECLGFSRWTKCKHIQLIEARLMLKLSWDY